MAFLVPVTCKNGEVSGRGRKRDGNTRAAIDSDGSITTRSLVKINGREVEEASNLILSLENVCVVPSWWNWTGCSWHPILI